MNQRLIFIGAGGKGGAERTFKVDRDAAIHFIHAAASIPTITRFLLISYIGSRRKCPSWWSVGDWHIYSERVNFGALANYYKAKLAADEELYRTSRASQTLVGVSLRPGTLTDEKAGKVTLGLTPRPNGDVSRESVAKVADAILAVEGLKNSWIDFYDGDEDIQRAVTRVVKEGVNTAEEDPVHQG